MARKRKTIKECSRTDSAFEAGNEITAENLHGYLPSATSVFTPAVSQEGGHSYASERELLFNMIFRMRNEIDSLRSTVESA